MKKVHLGLLLIPVALLIILVLGPILRDGMFLDGLVYTNIARNLANDVGTIWAPVVFRQGDIFYEHPVLLPYVASWFFSLLGDALFVEDIYNFTVLAGTVFFLHRIWLVVVENQYGYTFFFPLLLWVLNQEVQLRYPNSMLECGTALVLLATTYAYLKLQPHIVFSSGVVGVGVFLATLCKGPFGLFLLALPLLHQLVVLKHFSWRAALVPALTFSGCFVLLFSIEPASLAFFQRYVDQQVVAAVAGQRVENIATTRFDFLYLFVMLNLPGLALTMLVGLISPLKQHKHRTIGLMFIALGAAGILPLAISIKQAAYYQLVSLPFFVIGGGLILVPRICRLISYLKDRKTSQQIVLFVGFVGVFGATFFAASMLGTTDRRDREIIALTNQMAAVFDTQDENDYQLALGGNKSEAAARSYRLTNFLNRYHNIHLDQRNERPLTIYIKAGQALKPKGQILFDQDGVIIVRSTVSVE